MRLLVTALFWLVFAATAPIGFVLGVLLAVATAPFDRDRRLVHLFICRWVFSYLKLNPLWDVRVHGRERIPAGPSVIIANHQSMADIVACMGLMRSFKFVSKTSLFSLPLIGWMMSLAKYVSVERGKLRSARQMLDQCRYWLHRRMPILFFPEATYSPDGRLLPFKRGAFVLAIEEKVPMVPVLIEGTAGLVVEDGPWLNPRCAIRITVLKPIEVGELGEDDDELTGRVRALFVGALGQPE